MRPELATMIPKRCGNPAHRQLEEQLAEVSRGLKGCTLTGTSVGHNGDYTGDAFALIKALIRLADNAAAKVRP